MMLYKSIKMIIRALRSRRNIHVRQKKGRTQNAQSPAGGYVMAEAVCYGAFVQKTDVSFAVGVC